MLLSDQTISNILIAIPATIFALGSLMTARKGNQKADTAIAQNDVLVDKADKIQTSTDGNLSRVTDKLDAANARIESLEKLIGRVVNPAHATSTQDVDDALERFREQK